MDNSGDCKIQNTTTTPKRDSQHLKTEATSSTSLKSDIKPECDGPSHNEEPKGTDKFCMSKLCQSFISKFKNSCSSIFDTLSLMKEFAVKQRRIYDLMNIMEGSGCVKKISKRKYEWVGPDKSTFIHPSSQKGDATSLRQITARIKLLISKEKGVVTFSKINETLMRESEDKSVNPATIRRRIYECCKVLRIIGFIEKVGRHYQWAYNTSPQSVEVAPEGRRKPARKSKEICGQKDLINEIVSRFQSEVELISFIEKVKDSFSGKVSCKEQMVNDEEG